MGKKKISCLLSEESIDKAVKELNVYQKDIANKTDLFREKVAERIAEIASRGFNNSIVDDSLNGNSRKAEVDVSISDNGSITTVIANGEDAVWVEFGAGVYHNGSAGSSPHPSGSELGFTIGSYGKGRGKQKVWVYFEDGELKLTHGTPATMPMYMAMQDTLKEIVSIAKEVFK